MMESPCAEVARVEAVAIVSAMSLDMVCMFRRLVFAGKVTYKRVPIRFLQAQIILPRGSHAHNLQNDGCEKGSKEPVEGQTERCPCPVAKASAVDGH